MNVKKYRYSLFLISTFLIFIFTPCCYYNINSSTIAEQSNSVLDAQLEKNLHESEKIGKYNRNFRSQESVNSDIDELFFFDVISYIFIE